MERIIRHESFARRIDFRFLQVVQLHPAAGLIPTRSKSVIPYSYRATFMKKLLISLIEPIFPSTNFHLRKKEIRSIFARRSQLLKQNNRSN